MKKIVLEETKATISLYDVPYDTPIFAKQNGKLIGMVVQEVVG